MRTEYEMTEEDLARILKASQPVTYIVVGGIEPRSPQENANDAWAELGRRMGFKPMTVRAVPGKGQRFFTAESVGAERNDGIMDMTYRELETEGFFSGED